MIRGVAISNLAWPQSADSQAMAAVRRLGFTGIEIAPARVVPDWPAPSGELGGLKDKLRAEGLSAAALQGILFGTNGMELFGPPAARRRLFDHLTEVARIGGELGAVACVYGAPKSRDPGALDPADALDQAVDFFAKLAPIFEDAGTCLTFEANAALYGCRFITHTREAIELVRRVNRPGVRLQIDTGTIFINGEELSIISEAVRWAGHSHASERNLSPLGTTGAEHGPIAQALAAAGYQGWISVEMRQVDDWAGALDEAARVIDAAYGFPTRPLR